MEWLPKCKSPPSVKTASPGGVCWGSTAWLAMLLEVRGRRILFDTGAGGTLIANTRALEVELDKLEAVVLSHGHYAGIIALAGCAHSGLINTLHHITGLVGTDHIYALLGGTHLKTRGHHQNDENVFSPLFQREAGGIFRVNGDTGTERNLSPYPVFAASR